MLFTLLLMLVPSSLGVPVGHLKAEHRAFSDIQLAEDPVPKAAFKLPPSESYKYQPRMDLPVYVNRIPVISYPFGSMIRAHSAPIYTVLNSRFPHNTRPSSSPLLVNMAPAFPPTFFQMRKTSETVPASNKFLTNMPPPFKFPARPQQQQVRLPQPTNRESLRVLSPVLSQFRSQDERGGYHFSYSGGPSSRSETRTPDGVVKGAYSYVDPNGLQKNLHYVADSNGYRVTSTNII